MKSVTSIPISSRNVRARDPDFPDRPVWTQGQSVGIDDDYPLARQKPAAPDSHPPAVIGGA